MVCSRLCEFLNLEVALVLTFFTINSSDKSLLFVLDSFVFHELEIKSRVHNYLVRDIKPPIYFHQTMKFFRVFVFLYRDLMNDAVKCILRHPQDIVKVG